MCGIAGAFAADGHGVAERELREVTHALAARGPDGEGFYFAPGIGLGHRRLAIIDVDGGQQPLFNEDRQITAVVNGEFYNYRELRRRLQGLGHVFASNSDSEVLLHGYEAWGNAVLERLEGMFAFALWDAKQRSLLLARDRMGEKPLYWAPLPHGDLVFASELRALRAYPGVDTSIDPAALARYLVYEHVPAPASIVRGVRKLEPGHALVVSATSPVRIFPYWDLPFANNPSQRFTLTDHDDAVKALRRELSRAVEERLVADVPVGIFLSGGIDSALVAALAARVHHPIQTFTVGFADPSFDESAPARLIAKHIGSQHHEHRVEANEVQQLLPQIGTLLDEPSGDSSIVPTHLLARFARQYITVALGGDGGDELFFGYPTFLAEPLGRMLFELNPAPFAAVGTAIGRKVTSTLPVSMRYFSFDFKLRQFLKAAGQQGARRHQSWLASLLPHSALGHLHPDIVDQAGTDLFDVVNERMARCPSSRHWDRLMYFYVKGYLGDGVLSKVDRATMAVGLESRAPMLDSQVVEIACRCSAALKLSRGRTKHLLKSVAKGLVPDAILKRPKQGFAMPISRWLQQELQPMLRDMLAPDRLRRQGLFAPSAVNQLVEEHVEGRADHRKPLWTLLAFQAWLQSFEET